MIEDPTDADIRDRAATWFVSVFFGLWLLIPIMLAGFIIQFN